MNEYYKAFRKIYDASQDLQRLVTTAMEKNDKEKITKEVPREFIRLAETMMKVVMTLELAVIHGKDSWPNLYDYAKVNFSCPICKQVLDEMAAEYTVEELKDLPKNKTDFFRTCVCGNCASLLILSDDLTSLRELTVDERFTVLNCDNESAQAIRRNIEEAKIVIKLRTFVGKKVKIKSGRFAGHEFEVENFVAKMYGTENLGELARKGNMAATQAIIVDKYKGKDGPFYYGKIGALGYIISASDLGAM